MPGVTVVAATCVPSLNPKICLGTSHKGGGFGLFAKSSIAKGEWVWREVAGFESKPRTYASLDGLPADAKRAYLHFAYCIGNDLLSGLPEFDTLDPSEWHTVRAADHSMYMNHSCDPTSWFVFPEGKVTVACDSMEATRDINAGEEITFDYGTTETFPQWHGFPCACGCADCRGQLSPFDWRKGSMQRKYAGHTLVHVAQDMARELTTAEFGLSVVTREDGSTRVHTSTGIAAGVCALVLAPNCIVKQADVTKPLHAIEVSPGVWSEPAFTGEMREHLARVGEGEAATLRAVVRPDLAVELFAAADIPAGGALTVALPACPAV